MYNNTDYSDFHNNHHHQESSSSSSPPSDVYVDWIEVTDPASGRQYYANLTTGETSWDPPPRPFASSYPRPHASAPHETLTSAEGSSTYSTTASVIASAPNNQHHHQQQQQQPVVTMTPMMLQHGSGLMLVPTVRTMMEAEQYHHRSVVPSLELGGLSAGQIADLCHLQQEQYHDEEKKSNRHNDDHGVEHLHEDDELEPYTPLQPYKMDERARRPPMESARLEVRMHALYEQLRQI